MPCSLVAGIEIPHELCGSSRLHGEQRGLCDVGKCFPPLFFFLSLSLFLNGSIHLLREMEPCLQSQSEREVGGKALIIQARERLCRHPLPTSASQEEYTVDRYF